MEKQKSTDDVEPQVESQLVGAREDAAAIPKGTLDPVYEAKARVLNAAVRLPCTPEALLHECSRDCRSKILVWDGTNGNSSSSWALDGPATIYGLSSLR